LKWIMTLFISLLDIPGFSENKRSDSPHDAIQGHWRNDDGVEYYISEDFVKKDTDGVISRFINNIQEETFISLLDLLKL
jgi:hypothetical protein